MNGNIFQEVKDGLQSRLGDVVQELLPGGRISGKEYLCASLQGGSGESCRTNLETGKGSDFASGDAWGDIIGLAAKVWNMRQGEAAGELKKQYNIGTAQVFRPQTTSSTTPPTPATFTPILPVPPSAPEPPCRHPQHGQYSQIWRYGDMQGRALAYAVRFDLPDGKAVLPLCYGNYGSNTPQWAWKALPEPRPLYGLSKLAAMPDASILLVEGEKTADAAQVYFPHHAALTWSGGSNAVGKADFSPLQERNIIIWPDNDEPGFAAALELARTLDGTAQSIAIVQPPDTLPDGWDLADQTEPGFIPQVHIETAMPVAEFIRRAAKRYPCLAPSISVTDMPTPDPEDITIKEWPVFSFDACPGILGAFVKLATRDSEADPAAVAITTLVRFCAEIYGHAPNQGPHHCSY